LVPYDNATGHYDGDRSRLALEGEYRVVTAQGEVVCHPGLRALRYQPEAVEAVCWLPRAQVEHAASLVWHSRPVSYYAWSEHEQHANVTQTARTMSLPYALTASFGRPSAQRMGATLGLAERHLVSAMAQPPP
jgi:anaerobic selenocysteine-containing dehydrogenase